MKQNKQTMQSKIVQFIFYDIKTKTKNLKKLAKNSSKNSNCPEFNVHKKTTIQQLRNQNIANRWLKK